MCWVREICRNCWLNVKPFHTQWWARTVDYFCVKIIELVRSTKEKLFSHLFFFSHIFFSHMLQQLSLDEATDPWGVKVERVEMWVWCCAGRTFCFCYVHCSSRNKHKWCTSSHLFYFSFSSLTFPFWAQQGRVTPTATATSDGNWSWSCKVKWRRESEIIVKTVNNLKFTFISSSPTEKLERRWLPPKVKWNQHVHSKKQLTQCAKVPLPYSFDISR